MRLHPPKLVTSRSHTKHLLGSDTKVLVRNLEVVAPGPNYRLNTKPVEESRG